ncbi:class I SAM-dependent methyltransferase [Amycolatopsis samaneae]|uniref:Class I SAM-dependent methyltransferase n=1 Tax=Amycolatopsis samaneae TaxID=664691 RepID=A0ABW5GR75_9PSEU
MTISSGPHSGPTGAGPFTPDGCSVELYARLPWADDVGVVAEAAGGPASVLELGCGAGRVTHALLSAGHRVVGVDQSAEMLRHVRGARTVLGTIEELRLGERFEVVLLMSYLLSMAEKPLRARLLATCREHLADDGVLLLQWFTPEWFDTVTPREQADERLRISLHSIVRDTPGRVHAVCEYTLDAQVWQQPFTVVRIERAELRAELAAAGLRWREGFAGDRNWVLADPVTG